MRAFSKDTYNKLRLKTTGMEFASEMLIRAAEEKLKITEIPINYSRRISPTKLARFKDAWRHIRFMLLFAPTYLFIIPGSTFLILGLIIILILYRGPFPFLGRNFDFHTMILASMLVILGYEVITLGIYAKTYSWLEGFTKKGWILKTTLHFFKLEKGIALGLVISFIGFLVGFTAFIGWVEQGFGPLSAIRPAIISFTFIVLGIQILFSSFFLSVLGIERARQEGVAPKD